MQARSTTPSDAGSTAAWDGAASPPVSADSENQLTGERMQLVVESMTARCRLDVCDEFLSGGRSAGR